MSAAAKSEKMRSTGWIALYTKANQEKTAITNIERQGFRAYCPMIERTRRHARKIEKSADRSFLPMYLFAWMS